jgi:aldehyde dehydrogenase (NAD+)
VSSPENWATIPAFASLDRPKQHFISNRWVDSAGGKTFESINPSTGETLAHVARGSSAEVDLAVRAAADALEGPWSRFKPSERERVLLRLADLIEANAAELGLLNVAEMGVPVNAQRGGAPAGTLRYFAGWATKLHGRTVETSEPGSFLTYTRKEPVGVVGSIIPWNSPLAAPVWKIAPVLATGCTMVLKPAEEACLTPLRLGELIAELDLPPGVVNIVTGFGDAGAALVDHPAVAKIAFTGSTATGQSILRGAASNLKRVSLELGGKSADIIFADADIEAASARAAMAVFGNTGQVCSAGTRVFVERPVYEEIIERVATVALELRVGNSLDPDTQIGPLVSEAQLERVEHYLRVGVEQEARLVVGGHRLMDQGRDRGFFVEPTVFADVADGMAIAREEIFGPVASILPFDTVDEVIARANSSQYGLGGGVWTRDISKAIKVAHGVKTGSMWVNTYGHVDPSMPFGGVKMSGIGRELSEDILHEYVSVKGVWIRWDT